MHFKQTKKKKQGTNESHRSSLQESVCRGKTTKKTDFWLGKYLMQPMLLKSIFVYHFNLMTSIICANLGFGEKIVFTHSSMCSLIQQAFQLFLKLRGLGDCWLSTFTFLPPISQVTKTWFLPYYSKNGLWEVISGFLPIQLLLIWLFCRFQDHLLPLGTLCLRIIIFLMACCP